MLKANLKLENEYAAKIEVEEKMQQLETVHQENDHITISTPISDEFDVEKNFAMEESIRCLKIELLEKSNNLERVKAENLSLHEGTMILEAKIEK